MWWLWLLLLASFVLFILWLLSDKKNNIANDIIAPVLVELSNNNIRNIPIIGNNISNLVNNQIHELQNKYVNEVKIDKSPSKHKSPSIISNIYPTLDEIKNMPNEISNEIPNIYPNLNETKKDSKTKKKTFKYETYCCEILENITGKKFKRNIRPSFLRNPETGHNCELDCYNEELKLALEYNGKQHYVFPNYWHKKYEDFIAGLRRDQFKIEACEANDIYLIIVPYTIKKKDLENYIRSRMPGVYKSPNID